MNLTDKAIDSPRRTEMIIACAKIAGIDLEGDALIHLALDTFDSLNSDSIYPFYDVAPDRTDADLNAFMIYLIGCMSGSDDDLDELIHDLSHALEQIEQCTDHPGICSSCCDLHNSSDDYDGED
jgi:hypothetical protein